MDSRYFREHRTPIRKRKRVVRLPGAFDERGKWFKCWNCGFICNVDRNVGANGYNSPIEFQVESNTQSENYFIQPMRIFNRVPFIAGVIIRLDASGSKISIYRGNFKDNIVKGCPFCGATNIY